jgi:RNA polymerase sigma-70 factor, ECF subfamily
MQRFEQIYVENRDAVAEFVRRRASASVVDDVVSETFLICLRKIDRVPEEPLPWLYAVARKTLANHRRKHARAVFGEGIPGGEPAPTGDGELAKAFNALSDRDREILRLVAWESLSLAAAGTVLGCSSVACRVRYHRAKSRLASNLAERASFHPEPKGVTR